MSLQYPNKQCAEYDDYLAMLTRENKVYRILNLREAYFLDDRYFIGRESAENYLNAHMRKVQEGHKIKVNEAFHLSSPIHSIIERNSRHYFEIVEG